MASSNRCSTCQKNPGISFCPGCKAYFCDKDFKAHRGILVRDLDRAGTDRNELQGKIKKVKSLKQPGNLLLTRIDEWQQLTIEKVKQAAQQARQQVVKIMNSKRDEITREFQTLTEEIECLKDSESVLEPDLINLKRDLSRLNKDVEQFFQPSTIEVNMKQSDQIVWNHMIYVEEKSLQPVQQQLQVVQPQLQTVQPQPKSKYLDRFYNKILKLMSFSTN